MREKHAMIKQAEGLVQQKKTITLNELILIYLLNIKYLYTTLKTWSHNIIISIDILYIYKKNIFKNTYSNPNNTMYK